MHSIEVQILAKCNIRLWKRFLDDIFFVTDNPVNMVLNAANSVNPHIQFTSEMPSEQGLPYLDTLVSVSQETKLFRTTLYVKPIASGYVMPFASHVPKGRKRATVRTEFMRARQVSSDEDSYQTSRKIIWNKFVANGYPKYLIAQEERNAQQHRRRTPQPWQDDLHEDTFCGRNERA